MGTATTLVRGRASGLQTSAQIGPDVPESLERVILKALEKDRALRYQHASEIRADLLRLKRDTESSRDAVAVGASAARPARRRRTLIVAAIAVAAAILAAGYGYFRRPPALTDKDTIVLADFKNTTGDEVFDETLRRGLAVQLEQSLFLSLVC